MTFLLAAALMLAGAEKPTVSVEQSCDEARAIVVVQNAPVKGDYRVLDVLYDGAGAGLKKDAKISVDLKGMVYENDQPYILFIEPAGKDKGYRAVSQMRTEDAKATRERIKSYLQKSGKLKKD